jgi:hypothetical protein
MKQVLRIEGTQGSWAAEVTYTDGSTETLACVHAVLCQGQPMRYLDRGWLTQLSKFPRYFELINEKRRVIVTNDQVGGDGDVTSPNNSWRRKGYVGVFDITEPTAADGLQFEFTKRLPQDHRFRRRR